MIYRNRAKLLALALFIALAVMCQKSKMPEGYSRTCYCVERPTLAVDIVSNRFADVVWWE